MKNKIIYRHLKPNGEVFYIGIGTKNRSKRKDNRNKYWHHIVNKYGYEVQILKSGLSWEEAIELEKILISYYGRRDLGTGTLVNMTDGGEGKINYSMSDETKRKIGEKAKGRFVSNEVRNKISKATLGKNKGDHNGMYGKSGSLAPNHKKIINVETGEIYESMSRCAEFNNLTLGQLHYRVSGKSKKPSPFKYLENKIN